MVLKKKRKWCSFQKKYDMLRKKQKRKEDFIMKQQNDLGKDPIPTLVIKLAIPTMIAQFVNVLYAIVDRMYIGNIPKIGDIR